MVIKNKVVVLIGGAGLLGRAFSLSILKHGGKLVVADIDLNKIQVLRSDILKSIPDSEVLFIEVDITSLSSIENLIQNVHARYGKIDAVVNNAYPRNKNYGQKLEHVTYDDFCENLNMHLGGYFLSTQRFSLYFKNQTFGHVINISSIYGIIPPRFNIYEGTSMTMPVEYAAIKSAIQHLSLYFMRYYKGTRLRFNVLSLGGLLDGQPSSFVERYKEFSNYKGMLEPSDITGSLIYLISEFSEFVNGQNIIVDDGWSR